MNNNKNKYDVVIIGSGLGGLYSGALLAKKGKRVCVLEKHFQIGGNLQVFKRKGCSFSAGMHYGGVLDKGQTLYKVFTYLGIYDKLKLTRLDENCFEKIYLGDKEYCYAMGMDNFKNKLISYFPNEKKAIETYTKKLDEIWDNSDLINFRSLISSSIASFGAYEINAYDYIDSLTDNDELKGLLAATNPLYVGIKKKTPLYVHAIINNFFIKSAWRIGEDGGNLANLFTEIIIENGGCVLKNKEVKKLNFENNKAISAQVADNEIFYGNNFISNIHPVETFKLIDKGILRKAYTNRIEKLENTMSMFMVFAIVNKKKIKHINSNIYYMPTNKVWEHYEYTKETWPKGYMMYTTEDAENKGYAESVVVVTMMNYEDVKKWENTKVMKRGDEYLKFKKEKEDKLLKLLYGKYPEVENEITDVYSATPLTFRDYTASPQGSPYGIVKDCNNPLGTFLSPKTRVSNLFLAGQNTGSHGLLGVIMSSFGTCAELIDVNEVLSEIREIK